MLRKLLICVLALSASALPAPAAADDEDHDRARKALEAGEILPLAKILDRLRAVYPGDALEVELERDDNRWLYEVKLLRSDGKLLKLKVDARDGEVIGAKDRARSDEHSQGRKTR